MAACETCGGELPTEDPRAKTCSNACRMAKSRAKPLPFRPTLVAPTPLPDPNEAPEEPIEAPETPPAPPEDPKMPKKLPDGWIGPKTPPKGLAKTAEAPKVRDKIAAAVTEAKDESGPGCEATVVAVLRSVNRLTSYRGQIAV